MRKWLISKKTKYNDIIKEFKKNISFNPHFKNKLYAKLGRIVQLKNNNVNCSQSNSKNSKRKGTLGVHNILIFLQ